MNFQTCCAIVPMSDEFTPTPYLNITTKDVVELEYYTSQKLLLVDNSEVDLIWSFDICHSFVIDNSMKTITILWIAETFERTICHYLVFNGMATWKGSAITISYVDGDFLASYGKNCKRRWAYCHALPVILYYYQKLFKKMLELLIIQSFMSFLKK